MCRGIAVEQTMIVGTGRMRARWLCAALWIAGCSTTTAGGGGSAVADVAPDLAITSFGNKDTAAGKDIATFKDTGAGAADAIAGDDAALDDTGADDVALDDSGPDDATDLTDQDTGIVDVPDITTPKDTVAKDTVAKDTGTDTGGKDTSTADVGATCGNGTCGAGETCENCAVDCPCKPCNPLTSVGCTTSQQCYVATAGLQCGGFGTVADGGPCKYLNDCALGSMCVGAICRKVCATAGTSLGCTAPAVCEELANGTTSLGYNLGACFAPENCNLVTSVGCPTGQACLPSSNGKQCAPAGKVGLDGACKSVSDCDIGFLCLNGATTSTCKKRCNTTDATTCPSGLACGPITIGSPPVSVGENFGVCDKP